MQKRVLLIMCFAMLLFTACGKTIENEKDKTKSRENVESQTDNDEILVETEYGNYVMDAEWFDTQEISSGYEGLGFSHSYYKPGNEASNGVNISYAIMLEEVDMSNHELRINEKLEYYQKSDYYGWAAVSVEDYDSENHDEVFLFTFTDNQGEVVRREYIMIKGQDMFSVSEDSGAIYVLSEQTEMSETSDRIAKRALESFQWIN